MLAWDPTPGPIAWGPCLENTKPVHVVQALEKEVRDLEHRLQLCRQEGRELDLQKSQVSDKLAAAEMVMPNCSVHGTAFVAIKRCSS